MSTATLPNPESSSSSSSILKRASSNLKYLAYGSQAGQAAIPNSYKTRSLLITTRYILKFVFWRVMRYAKYAALGAIATTLGGTLFGSLLSGGAFLIAPSAVAGIGIGIGVAVSKFAWRHRPSSIRHLESRILSILPFTQSPIPISSTPSSASITSSRHGQDATGGFFSWASDRAHSGASARSDEVDGEAELDSKRDARAEGRVDTKGDVWMRA